jgi:hypothetical protein
MKKICYAVAASLDGYIAGPKSEADWIIIDPEIDFEALFKRFDTVLMGHRTFAAMEKMGQGPMFGMGTFPACPQVGKGAREKGRRRKEELRASHSEAPKLRRDSCLRRSRLGSAPGKIEHEQTGRERGDQNNESGKLPRAPRREDGVRSNVRGAFHPFRCRFERPGNIEDYAKANRHEYHQPCHCGAPLFMAEEQKRHRLNHQPCDHGVSSRNFENIAPFEFAKEDLCIHVLVFCHKLRKLLSLIFLRPRKIGQIETGRHG